MLSHSIRMIFHKCSYTQLCRKTVLLAFVMGIAACHFRQNYCRTMVYHRSIMIRGTSTACISVSWIHASTVCAHASHMHLCTGYFDWCHIKRARYKPFVHCLLDSYDQRSISLSVTLAAKYLAAASFWGMHGNSHWARSNKSYTTAPSNKLCCKSEQQNCFLGNETRYLQPYNQDFNRRAGKLLWLWRRRKHESCHVTS